MAMAMAMYDFLTLKVLSVSIGFQRYYDDDFGGNLFTVLCYVCACACPITVLRVGYWPNSD